MHRICPKYDPESRTCEWNGGDYYEWGSGSGCRNNLVKEHHITSEGDGLSHQGESGITLPSDSPNPYPDREVDEYIEHKRRLACEYVQECVSVPSCNKRCL